MLIPLTMQIDATITFEFLPKVCYKKYCRRYADKSLQNRRFLVAALSTFQVIS